MELNPAAFNKAYRRVLYHHQLSIKDYIRQARDRQYICTVILEQVARYKAGLYSNDLYAPIAHIYAHYHKTGQPLAELLPVLRYEFSPENLQIIRTGDGKYQMQFFDVMNGQMATHNLALKDEKVVPMLQDNEQQRRQNERRLRLLDDKDNLHRVLIQAGLLEDIPSPGSRRLSHLHHPIMRFGG
jgi:hypothetical protein